MERYCDTCMRNIEPGCDWNQGRCPHREPMIDSIMLDNYKARFFNLMQSIKNLFTKDDCDCGHKH